MRPITLFTATAIAVVALLLAHAEALPQHDEMSTPDGFKVSLFWDTAHANECGRTTYVNTASPFITNPLTHDCRAMVDKVDTDYVWNLIGSGVHSLRHEGTCDFRVQSDVSDHLQDKYSVGGQDIHAILIKSLADFGSYKQVGAEGRMLCTAWFGNGTTHVNWTIGLYQDPRA